MAKGIAGEEAVDIGALHAAVGRDRAVGAAVDRHHRSRAVGAFAAAEMDFVALDGGRPSRNALPVTSVVDLSALITVSTSSRPRPSTVAGAALDAVRIGDGLAQHLIAAAEAQHVAAAADMRVDVDVPALRPQKGEIADGRFGAGKNDEVGIRPESARPAGRRQFDAGLEAQRIEIVEIGDAGSTGTAMIARRRPPMRRDEIDGILRRQPAACGSHGTTPSDGQPVSRVIAASP